MSVDFGKLTLTRAIGCPPDRLFALLIQAEARAVWGTPSETAVFDILESDPRPGGYELARCGPSEHPEFVARTDFHVIDGPSCLICTETITVEGAPICVSLVTLEIAADGTGSDLTVTIQFASLCGPEMVTDYDTGWSAALDKLVKMAEQSVTAH